MITKGDIEVKEFSRSEDKGKAMDMGVSRDITSKEEAKSIQIEIKDMVKVDSK
jgi:hypothetical protein